MSSLKVQVLGISGTPRGEQGRSDELLCDLLYHAKNFGAYTELLRLSEKKVLPCAGCYSSRPEDCIFPCIHDGMDNTQEVLEKIILADALAIATHVHWGGHSSHINLLIGKMTAIENNLDQIRKKTGREPLVGKPFALIASQSGEGASMALSQINWAVNHMGMFCVPWGMIYEPVILKKTVVRAGLRVIGHRKFEWIPNTIRLAARNLVLLARKLAGYEFDDYLVKEPRC